MQNSPPRARRCPRMPVSRHNHQTHLTVSSLQTASQFSDRSADSLAGNQYLTDHTTVVLSRFWKSE